MTSHPETGGVIDEKDAVSAALPSPVVDSGVSRSERLPQPPLAEGVIPGLAGLPAKAALWEVLEQARLELEQPTARESNLPGNEGVHFFAANPSQQLTARFEGEAVRLQSGQNDEWNTRVRATAVRRGDEEMPLPATSAPMPGVAEVSYRRGKVVEWWKNHQEGLEHGFTLAERPIGGDGRLEIDVEMSGLSARVSGDSVRLSSDAGVEVMSYSGLRVWDAQGNALDAEMTARDSTVSILIADANAVYPVTVDPVFATLESELDPNVLDCGRPNDLFGHDVSVCGEYAIVGVPGDDNLGGNDAGAAYLFQRETSGWSVLVKLKALDAAAGDRLGGSVAMGKGFALVGARLADIGATQDAGAVYSFASMSGMWMQFFKLRASNFSENGWFGDSISLNGDYSIIGASNVNDGRGLAYIWKRLGTSWIQQAILQPAVQSSQDQSGRSVALAGGYALVGAPGYSGQAGAAYLFSGSGTSWSELQLLQASSPASMDYFGRSVGMGTTCALVGAPGRDTSDGADAGAVYAFAPNGGSTWSPTQTLSPTRAAGGDQFGAAVDVFGKIVIAGAPGRDASYSDQGAAFVFAPEQGSSLAECAELHAPSPAQGDAFGNAVSLDGMFAAVGAYTAQGSDPYAGTIQDRGSAYVFKLSSNSNPDISVRESDSGGSDEDSTEIGETASLDFGSITVCTTACRFFTIRNTGLSPLENLNVSISGSYASEFRIDDQPPSTLAPGSVFNLKLIFEPQTEGSKSAYLNISSNDSATSSIMISMFGVATPASMPVIMTHPMSQFIPLGTGARLSSTATGDPVPTYQWFKDGSSMQSQTRNVLDLFARDLTSAGSYYMEATNKAGYARSNTAEIAVVDTRKRDLCVPCDTSVTLNCDAAGNNLSFYWFKDGQPLSTRESTEYQNGQSSSYQSSYNRISIASDGKSVTIQMLNSGDSGAYSCQVYGPAGSIIGGCYNLTVLTEGPSLSSFSLPNARINCPYSFQVPYDSAPYRKPTSFSASGLPAGLTMNSETGVISGTATEAGNMSYSVEITASNDKGSDSTTSSLYVIGLPCGAVGTFKGLVDRSGALNGSLGGAIDVTVTATGAYTGSLRLGGEQLPFSGTLEFCAAPYMELIGRVSLAREEPFRRLSLEFSINATTGCLTGSMTDFADRTSTFQSFAGVSGSAGYVDGRLTSALFDCPCGIAPDKVGNLFVADTNNHVIRRISPSGDVITFAGENGQTGDCDGCDPDARFNSPKGVTVCPDGFLYVADSGNRSIRKVSPEGKVTTLAGGFLSSSSSSSNSQESYNMSVFNNPVAITCGPDGCLYVADAGYHAIMKVTPSGEVTVLAGERGSPGHVDGSQSGARFNSPSGIAYHANRNEPVLYVADTANHVVRQIEIRTQAVITYAGVPMKSGHLDGTLEKSLFYSPTSVTVDGLSNVFVTDVGTRLIRRIDERGTVSTITRPCPSYYQPGWTGCYTADKGINMSPRNGNCQSSPTPSSSFGQLGGIVFSGGRLYVSDCALHTISMSIGGTLCEAAVYAKRNPWGTDTYSSYQTRDKGQSMSCFMPPATSYAGDYKFVMEPCSSVMGQVSIYPQGNGFGTMTVTTDGMASVSGKLADGTQFTASTCLVGRYFETSHCLPWYSVLYDQCGSILGWQRISAQSVTPPAPPSGPPSYSGCFGNLLDGCLDWLKIPVKSVNPGRNYTCGIPLHRQTVIGEQSVSSSSSNSIIYTFFQSPPENARLAFSEGGLNPNFSQVFDLDSNGSATFPSSSYNPMNVAMSFSTSNCEFSGTFDHPNGSSSSSGSNPPAPVRRGRFGFLPGGGGTSTPASPTVSFQGIFLCRLGYGAGYFLLEQPDSQGNLSTSTPIYSGQVILSPNNQVSEPVPTAPPLEAPSEVLAIQSGIPGTGSLTSGAPNLGQLPGGSSTPRSLGGFVGGPVPTFSGAVRPSSAPAGGLGGRTSEPLAPVTGPVPTVSR